MAGPQVSLDQPGTQCGDGQVLVTLVGPPRHLNGAHRSLGPLRIDQKYRDPSRVTTRAFGLSRGTGCGGQEYEKQKEMDSARSPR